MSAVHGGASGASRLGRRWRALSLAMVVLFTVTATGAADASPGVGASGDVAASRGAAAGGPPVTVMTRNIYLGSELGSLFAVEDEAQLVEATSRIWATMIASDVPARAEALAAEVAEHRPLLIGLQEVSRWDAVGGTGTETVTVDFLDVLVEALAARDQHYEAVSISEAFEGTLPAFVPELGFSQVTLLDRDVILVRADVPPAQLRVLNEDSGLFETALELPILDGTLRIDRGWNLVDVRVRNRTFRFVNSHLEAFDRDETIRMQQARELLDGPLATDLPVVLLGDFNSDAGDDGPAYGILTGDGGFDDAWRTVNPGDPGPTCCHAADLRNEVVDLRSRIDLILVRDGVRVRDLERVGIDPAMRTPSGLWPSDHAGVVGRLMITGR